MLLHFALFLLLFLHFGPTQTVAVKNVNIVKAVAINEKELQQATAAPPPPPAPKVTAPSQNEIRHIEQVALKEQESPPVNSAQQEESKPPVNSVKPKEAPLPQQPTLALQEPKLEEKLALKKQKEKQATDLKKKEEQLAKKQREEEARQLQNELASESKSVTPNPISKNLKANESSDETSENLEEQLSAEKKQMGEAQAIQAQEGEIDKYKQMIIQTISRKWMIPDVEDKTLACQLLVHVGPGGIVLNVEVLKESGDATLDRSARNAIMKASPLPVPENSELFDNFRALRLTFRPQGIISS